jgi:hypothetical protein
MDSEALRIRELVIEAGALVDWLETGRGDLEIVGAALIYLRDQLCGLAEETGDAEACSAACGMVEAIDQTLTTAPARRQADRAA